MDPMKIATILTPLMEEGKLMKVIRRTIDDERALWLKSFHGEIANCSYTAIGPAPGEIAVFDAWEDMTAWETIVFVENITLDELKIKMKVEQAQRSNNGPPQELVGLLGRLGIEVDSDTGSGAPPTRTN